MVRYIQFPKINFEIPHTPGRTPLGAIGTIMRLQYFGCRNRPIFHLVVVKDRMPKLRHLPVVERVGIYDPTVNAHGEKLVSLNIERIQHYLSQGIKLDVQVSMLLGLAGFLPQDPQTYILAWRNRKHIEEDKILNETDKTASEVN